MGKQILEQREIVTTEHVGSGGGPIEVVVKPDLTRLTDEEVLQLRALVGKTQPQLAAAPCEPAIAASETSQEMPQ